MKFGILVLFLLALIGSSGCTKIQEFTQQGADTPRLVLFVGADISGSFLKSKHFDDSLDFLAHYLHAHLNGYGGLEKPTALFVGSIGGARPDEPKTLHPIQTFQNESIAGIRQKLTKIFPKNKSNPYTDYNAFFKQIANTVESRKLMLKPISIVMMSDGKPDVPGAKGKASFRNIELKPLEKLSRNVTLRVLYTDAVVGMGWQTKIPRKRVKVWTQDAAVMTSWRDPKNLRSGRSFSQQTRFFDWIKDNVDFAARSRRVN